MRLLICLFFVFATTATFAQNFEGKIVYENSYKSKIPAVTDEQFVAMLGNKQDYYIKGNNYKSVTNGQFVKSQLYRGAENKSYTLTAKSDTLYWQDFSENKTPATRFEILKGKDTVMGLPCDVLIIYSAEGKVSYSYNAKYGVDASLYKQHAFSNWYYAISKMNALPLRTVYEDAQFVLTSTAVSADVEKLNGSVFEIADKAKVAKLPW